MDAEEDGFQERDLPCDWLPRLGTKQVEITANLNADSQQLRTDLPPMNLKGIKLTWLGHATFRMETPAGKTILLDPWVMQNPMCPENEKAVKKVDVMLCTHGHFDHIGDAVEIAKKHKPIVVGIPELGGWLEKKGVKQTSMMNKGGTQAVGDIKSHHGARRSFVRNTGWRPDRLWRRS